jgi:hypothetical protein
MSPILPTGAGCPFGLWRRVVGPQGASRKPPARNTVSYSPAGKYLLQRYYSTFVLICRMGEIGTHELEIAEKCHAGSVTYSATSQGDIRTPNKHKKYLPQWTPSNTKEKTCGQYQVSNQDHRFSLVYRDNILCENPHPTRTNRHG